VLPESVFATQDYAFWEIGAGHSDFNKQTHEIDVFMTFGDPKDPPADQKPPCKFTVTVAGRFQVDTTVFKEENIEAWAKSTGPYLLFPYLREQVYALSTRARLRPIIIPVFKIPTALTNVPAQV